MATHFTKKQVTALCELGRGDFREFKPMNEVNAKPVTLNSLIKNGWIETNEQGHIRLTWQVLVKEGNSYRLPLFIKRYLEVN